jgi:hypothetical protein
MIPFRAVSAAPAIPQLLTGFKRLAESVAQPLEAG